MAEVALSTIPLASVARPIVPVPHEIVMTEWRASASQPIERQAQSIEPSSSSAAAMHMLAAASTEWYVSGMIDEPVGETERRQCQYCVTRPCASPFIANAETETITRKTHEGRPRQR